MHFSFFIRRDNNFIVIIFQSEKNIKELQKISKQNGIDISKALPIAFKIKKEAHELIEKSVGCISDRVAEIQEKSKSLIEKINEQRRTLADLLVANQNCGAIYPYGKPLSRKGCLNQVYYIML